MMYEDWMERFLWHVIPLYKTYPNRRNELMIKHCDGKFYFVLVRVEK